MKKRILVVDDEKRIRDIYKQLLFTIGSSIFDVVQADSAEEATEMLIREPIDIVLLDIRMPGINGQVLFDVIKEYDPDMRVIVTSVFPIETQKRMIPNADDYYDKSCGPFQFIEKITDHFTNYN